ncbi:MAG: hypothetical protein MUF10_16310, partial [Thermoanaerobaculaceae bacterium]|nr:hypothetical protein [Thermoanaerobaculaceae bacterium]
MRSRPHPLVELTRARLVEFLREPEAVFWVFVFPVLLAVALGIAFRNQPASTTPVGLTGRSEATARVAALLAHDPTLRVQQHAAS